MGQKYIQSRLGPQLHAAPLCMFVRGNEWGRLNKLNTRPPPDTNTPPPFNISIYFLFLFYFRLDCFRWLSPGLYHMVWHAIMFLDHAMFFFQYQYLCLSYYGIWATNGGLDQTER